MDSRPIHNFEEELHERLSIRPMRAWLRVLAEQQLPSGLKGKVDASDIVQQTFVEAWRGQAEYRGTTQQEHLAWMRVILTRIILRNERDQLKTKKRGEGRERQLQAAIEQTSVCLDQLAIGKDPSPQSAAALAEESLLLASALEALPEAYRQVLIMRQFDDMSYAEIAQSLGRTESAIRMSWVRGLSKLKKIYTEANSRSQGS